MKKELPSVKKGLKEFILDEDAKVIDRTATKIAVTSAFIAINFLANTDDAHAKGHKNHSNHANNVNAENTYGTGIHGGTNPMQVVVNEIPQKAVETMHSNHYNHTDNSGGQGLSMVGFIIGAVAAAAGGAGIGAGLTLVISQMSLGATAGFIAGVGAAGYAGGLLLGGSATEGSEGIDTGSPHYMPEPILTALEEEEK